MSTEKQEAKGKMAEHHAAAHLHLSAVAGYVYLPWLETMEKWMQLAGEAGISISTVVVEDVERSLRQDDNGYSPCGGLVERVR